MIRYLEVIETLPSEIKLPLIKAFELFKEEIAETVKRSDFEELKAVVRELAEAQRRTEGSLESFKRTTEENFNRVWKAIDELAEAQKRTEERVEELAEAQKKTEQRLAKLIGEVEDIKENLGGLSHTVGYRLEDEAFKALPELLKRDFNIEVIGRLKREFIEIGKNRYIEVNIWGKGKKNGKEYVIIGEGKSQLKKKDIDLFLKKMEEVKRHIPKEQIPLIITYIAHPSVQEYAANNKIKLYFSYEL